MTISKPFNKQIKDDINGLSSQMAEINHNVDSFIIEGASDRDGEAIKNAIRNLNGGSVTLLLSDRDYNVKSKIEYTSNIIFQGIKGKTVIKSDVGIYQLFINKANLNVENVTFRDIIFVGGVNEIGIFPRTRESRITTPSIKRAINSYTDVNTSVKNITINNCKFLNIEDLPVYLDGVKGETIMTKCFTSNCVDIGFINCERITFTNNIIEKSSDNGVSISRNCKKVICTGNKVKQCAYSGIWISGWSNESSSEFGLGAEDFICDGNLVENCGHFGIQLTDAPKNGSVCNNIIKNITRGTYDEKNDFRGVGIKISSSPEVKYLIGEIEVMAENLIVKDNNILSCERGGIEVRGLDTGSISANIIKNCGTKYLSDGVTVIPSSSVDQNFGIRCYIKNILLDLKDNKFIDNRTTPYSISPIIFLNDSSNSNTYSNIKDNISYGYIKKLTDLLRQDTGNTNILENLTYSIQNSSYNSYVVADGEGYKRMGLAKINGQVPAIVLGNSTPFRILKASTPNIDDIGATYTEVGYIDVGGNIVVNGSINMKADGSWGIGKHIVLGNYHLWIDTQNRLRLKNGSPTSEIDGIIVGTQS